MNLLSFSIKLGIAWNISVLYGASGKTFGKCDLCVIERSHAHTKDTGKKYSKRMNENK